MSKTHLVISDQHAHPDHSNRRADYLAKLICDVKPDVVVNIGDAADMPSLNGYDTGKKGFVGKNYEADISAHTDFQDRVWHKVRKQKKKLPHRIILEGNHENRIKKAINLQPHLEGDKYGISFKDLEFEKYYDEVVEYNGSTPGTISIDGITYAHYLISGVMGRPIGGDHHAASLLSKHHSSCTVGHSHLAGWAHRSSLDRGQIMGAVVGVFQDFDPDWAGESSRLWYRGLMVSHNVEDGVYDPEFISIDRLRKAYD